MKKNILILLVAVTFLGTSCQDFLKIDETNPNNPSKVAAKLELPGALNSVAFTMNYPRRFDFVYLWHGLWSVSAGYSQPQNLVQYKLLNSDYQQGFRDFYIWGQNFDVIEKGATDPKDAYYAAIAKIMKAYIFQNLVDCWGDVPYTKAFQATTGNFKPSYDSQQSIYEDLVVQLDAAMALIQNAPLDANKITSSSDFYYSGDMNKWLKFANTLKLRILVHQAEMSGRTSYIQTALATTSTIGYIGVGEGALNNPGYTPGWTSATNNQMNPFYGTFYNASGSSVSDGVTYYMAGKAVVDFMNNNNDPRKTQFFNATAAGTYVGNIFGYLPAHLLPFAQTSQLGYKKDDAFRMIGTPTKAAPILTDFESLFLQAEAAQRGLIAGSAQSFYESAVTQSFVYNGLTTAQAANYLAQANQYTNFANSSNKLSLIITQKWVALNGVAPVEIWNDFRRTGYPSGLVWSEDPARIHDTPPIRLLYPQDELNVNNAAVLAAMAQQNYVDEFTTKIFWMK